MCGDVIKEGGTQVDDRAIFRMLPHQRTGNRHDMGWGSFSTAWSWSVCDLCDLVEWKEEASACIFIGRAGDGVVP